MKEKIKFKVTKEVFVQKIMEYFKLINQGYPQKMQDTLRKQWEKVFEDIENLGFLLVEKESIERIQKLLKEMPWSAEIKSREIEKLLGVKSWRSLMNILR